MAKRKTLTSFKEVVEHFSDFRAAVDAWNEDKDGPFITYKGEYTKTFSAELEEGVASLDQFVMENEFAVDAYEIVLAIDRFVDAAIEWAHAFRVSPNHNDPAGSVGMWSAFDEVCHLCDHPVTWPPVESIEQLMREGATITQVAKIYGLWIDKDQEIADSHQIELLRRDRAKYAEFMKTWENPNKVKYDRKWQTAWNERQRELETREDFRTSLASDDYTEGTKELPVAPEPLEELAELPGMTIQQIANMKQMSVEEVRERLIEIRKPLDASMQAEIARAMRDDAQARREDPQNLKAVAGRLSDMEVAELDTHTELDSMELRVLAMLDDGLPPGTVSRALAGDYPGLSYENVVYVQTHRSEVAASVAKPYEAPKESKEKVSS